MIKFNVITIFPEAFDSYLKTSLLGKAQKKKLVKINLINLRDFASDKHKSARPTERHQSFGRVDDKAYGGGPGMVIKLEPIYKAIQALKSKVKSQKSKVRIILFSTRGKKFDQKTARRLSKYKNLILICGRYEGVDERVAEHIADEEISIGDFILSGGELPAMVLIETVSRHIKGVLGKNESLEEIKGSYRVYTRPPVFFAKGGSASGGKNWKVPKILLSGDHEKIKKWRKSKR